MSTLKVNTLQDASGGNASTTEQISEGRVKAWVNFDGAGTVAIRDSFNISSITDNHTGTYTANFSSAFANVNYTAVISGGHDSNSSTPRGFETLYNYQTGSVKFDFRDESNNETDPQVCCLNVCAS